MVKYTAKQLIDRSLALADLKNSDFLSYGELFYYMNDAYKQVYTDAYNAGELQYLKVYRLTGSGVYDLPQDLYTLVSITDDNGVFLERKRPGDPESTSGYLIANGKLYISGSRSASLVLTYLPTPETITSKAEPKEVECPIVPVAGYGSMVIDAKGAIYDVSLGEYVVESDEGAAAFTKVVLGAHTYVADGVEYDFAGNVLDSGNFLLKEDGSFIKVADTFDLAVSDDDEEALFFTRDNKLYLNSEDDKIFEADDTITNLRYVYFDGRHAVVVVADKAYLVFEDGEYANLNAKGVLLKTDIDTGYGFITKKGATYYVDGWLPETKIDYPNNVFFSLVAYKLAIAFRTKQSADASMLVDEYNQLSKTYNSTISVDGQSYPTIRNVYKDKGWY